VDKFESQPQEGQKTTTEEKESEEEGIAIWVTLSMKDAVFLTKTNKGCERPGQAQGAW
jgi:hypothetical protein